MENDILNNDFIDFQIFPIEEPEMLLEQALGGNNKKLLIFSTTKISEELFNFLSKILQAVKMDLKNDALLFQINERTRINFLDLLKQAPCDKAIFFGMTPSQIGLQLNIPNYIPFEVANRALLFNDSLENIQGQALLKKQLWNALKEMFEINK